jgi:cobalt-zinc-cadmium efflux system protein
VTEVHDLHVWAVGTSKSALTAHLVLGDAAQETGALLQAAELALLRQFDIRHATLQLEPPAYAQHCALRGEAACG